MSFFISALAMTALGFMAYLQEYYPTSNYWNYLSWVPITMIILAVMTRSAGKVIIYKSRKGAIFVEQNTRFGLIWGQLAILEKNWALMYATFEGVFFMFSLAKEVFNTLESGLKSCIIYLFSLFLHVCRSQYFFQFSNLLYLRNLLEQVKKAFC
jgi:hypothetical protein